MIWFLTNEDEIVRSLTKVNYMEINSNEHHSLQRQSEFVDDETEILVVSVITITVMCVIGWMAWAISGLLGQASTLFI